MTIRVCDKCGKQMDYEGYTFHVCFDMETALEKDVCKLCRKRLMATINTFFEKKEDDKHVGN